MRISQYSALKDLKDKMRPLKKFFLYSSKAKYHFFFIQDNKEHFLLLSFPSSTTPPTIKNKKQNQNNKNNTGKRDMPQNFRKTDYRCGQRERKEDTHVCTHIL